MQHLFDGYGMLSKFRFADGRVWVSNRFVESNSWKSFRDSGKMAFSEFGTGVSFAKTMWNMVKQYSGMGQGDTVCSLCFWRIVQHHTRRVQQHFTT
jgi:carlactone synthase / all-trans-10'-apo-beta-carotenal 13,14-cleaving dioxygenase